MPEILDSANKSPKETSPKPTTEPTTEPAPEPTTEPTPDPTTEPASKEDENGKSLIGVWEILFLLLFFALILWMKNKKRKNHQDD